ncbi:MAG: hypothetical protein ABGW91_04515 [Christiangramia sp.]
MRAFLFIIFIFASFSIQAQEYERWNREDFEINRKEIGISWKDFAFSWQTPTYFELPDGNFLDSDPYGQRKQVDMLAAMDEINRKKSQDAPNFTSPLSIPKREKKSFEVQVNSFGRDDNSTYINPFVVPTLNPYGSSRFRNSYSPFRNTYFQN